METKDTIKPGEVVQQASGTPTVSEGTLGLNTQVSGRSSTVSGAGNASGGVDAGHFVEVDIDSELLKYTGDDTPLMTLMLKAKKVNVKSPVVDHYMLDEPRYSVETTTAVAQAGNTSFLLPLDSKDQQILRPHMTLMVCGVDGYDETGASVTPGKALQLFVTGHDLTTGNPIVRCVNGPKSNAANEVCTTPAIPAGTTLVILANGLYETQKEVDPDLIVPQPTRVILQKRGMNQVVSDYFDAQKKRIPFTQAIIAEQAINNFKVRGNRTLWAGRKGMIKVDVPKMGPQNVWFTEGIRWQFKRELQHSGKWTIEEIIALAKMYFTGEDAPKTALLLAGKNLLESIQCIDYTNHPEIQITSKVNPAGWTVTNFHTVFGDIEIKREPTLDRLGWSNSGALIDPDRLVHYCYSTEHTFEDRVEGEEATRKGILVWDALALKGACHMWIEGDGSSANDSAVTIELISSAPESPTTGVVYYLTDDIATLGNISNAKAGEMYLYDGTSYSKYTGQIYALTD